jgi:hypothetical protein
MATKTYKGRTSGSTGDPEDVTAVQLKTDLSLPSDTVTSLAGKQATLVSATNIKTINGTSLLGSGNITISGGGSSVEYMVESSSDLDGLITTANANPTNTYSGLVNAVLTMSSGHKIVPSNVVGLEGKNGGRFELSSSASLRFEGNPIKRDEVGLFKVTSLPAYQWINGTQVSGNSIFFAAHSFVTGQQVRYTDFKYGVGGYGTVGGLTDGGLYYIIRVGSGEFKLATSYANAIAGTAITLTPVFTNQFFITHAPIAFAGAGPAEIRSDIIDTGDTSADKRLNLITRALQGKKTRILAAEGTISDNVYLSDYHSVMQVGDLQNNFAGGSGGYIFYPFSTPVSLGSNAVWFGNGYQFYESSVNYYTLMIAIRPGATNSIVWRGNFKGQGAAFDGSDSGVSIFGGSHNYVLECNFEGTSSYTLAIVSNTTDQPKHCKCLGNYLYNCLPTQNFFFGGGSGHEMSDNRIVWSGYATPTAVGFAIVDYEPNNELGVLSDITFDRNYCDLTGITNLSSNSTNAFLIVNPVDTVGYERFYIRDNIFIAGGTRDAQNANILGCMIVSGVDQGVVSGNRYYGLGNFTIAGSFGDCRRLLVHDNVSTHGPAKMNFVGCMNITVSENKPTRVPESGASEPIGIDESAARFFPILSISSATIRLYYDIFGPAYQGSLYRHFKGVRGYINTKQYAIASIASGSYYGDLTTEATMTATVSEPAPVMIASATDVNTSTGVFTKTAHGLKTGACVHYAKGTTAIGGLTDAGEYWVYKVDADHYKLATTYANALAGITINSYSGAGTGTQTFYLVFVVWCYDNEYKDNNAEVTFAPHSTSVEKNTPYMGTQAADGSVVFDSIKSGVTYTTKDSTGLTTISVPSTTNNGKKFHVYSANANGVRVMSNGAMVVDAGTVSTTNGFIQSNVAGARAEFEVVDGDVTVISKNGIWGISTLVGATLINAIDVGRLDGAGTVAGWEEDHLFTGGTNGSWAAYTADVSGATAPAPNAVYGSYRASFGTGFSYNWTGLNSAKDYFVRIHVIQGYAFAGAGSGLDVLINSIKQIAGYDVFTDAGGAQKARILEFFTPRGSTTLALALNNTVSGSGAGQISGLQLYELA